MTGFQATVNQFPAPAVEGDFASANPYASAFAGQQAFTVDANGLTVGRFARARVDTGKAQNASYGVAYRLGFVMRAQPVIITQWLAQSSLLMPAGIEVTLMRRGDFWARFAAGAVVGQKVYARYDDGSCISAVTGSPPSGVSFTGSVTSNVLTVTVADASGDAITPGMPISGGTITAGTKIVAQLTGTPGGVGTYSTTTTADSTSGTITAPVAEETDYTVLSTAGNGELAVIGVVP